ncbi:MAG: putative metal-dependent hydrolase [Planctomycetota bacterium]|jgi:predicted metal-dependent hydrolase
MSNLPYLNGYPEELRAAAQGLLESGELEKRLSARYPERHGVHSNKELNAYVQELKALHMRKAAPLASVAYDNRLHVVHNALGIHTTATRVQGGKLRKRREMRVASMFKDLAPEFLRMIVVHELAHMKHTDHDRDFYKLCTYMEPDYAQYELDLRLQLTVRDWNAAQNPEQ